MFRSRLLKACHERKLYLEWFHSCIPDTVNDPLKIMDKFKQWGYTTADQLCSEYMNVPCFYLGSITEKDEDIEKSINLNVDHENQQIRFIKNPIFCHLPYKTMCLAMSYQFDSISNHARVSDQEPETFEQVKFNCLLPITATDDQDKIVNVRGTHYLNHWAIQPMLFETIYKNMPKNYNLTTIIPCTTYLLEDENEYFLGIQTPGTVKDRLPGIFTKIMSSSLRAFLYFLHLLTCKNVVVRDWTPNGRKNNSPKHHRAELDYKVIHITLPKKRILHNGKEMRELPFHERENYGSITSRRGHFKTYTEKAPLFGKHVGTYYWPEIIGAKEGINYKVKIAN